MKKLDKLIKQAKQACKKSIDPVHIIIDDYCSACKGECKYWGMEEHELRALTDQKIVFIYGDLPDDDGVIGVTIHGKMERTCDEEVR